MKININRQEDRSEELLDFLSQTTTGSLATAGEQTADVCTFYFARIGSNLIFKSRTTSQHSINISKNNRVHVVVHDPSSNYQSKYGVQLQGTVERILDVSFMEQAVLEYDRIFTGAAKKLPSVEELCSPDVSSTFYSFRIKSFKITDETPDKNRTILDFRDL